MSCDRRAGSLLAPGSWCSRCWLACDRERVVNLDHAGRGGNHAVDGMVAGTDACSTHPRTRGSHASHSCATLVAHSFPPSISFSLSVSLSLSSERLGRAPAGFFSDRVAFPRSATHDDAAGSLGSDGASIRFAESAPRATGRCPFLPDPSLPPPPRPTAAHAVEPVPRLGRARVPAPPPHAIADHDVPARRAPSARGSRRLRPSGVIAAGS